MSLSRDWTAIKLWQQAKRDLGDVDGLLYNERFDLINRAVQTVAGWIYDLGSNFYMTEVVIVGSGGAYQTDITTSTGTYVTATQTLTLDTPSRDITSSDIGKIVAFRIGTTTYAGIINTIVSVSSFTIIGTGLPSSNGTLAEALIVGNTVTSNKISLSGLRMMMAGQQIKLELLSSTSGVTVKAGSMRDVDTFRTSGANKNTILWGINGDYIQFTTGDSVVQGTLTLRYPKMADLLSTNAGIIDLPDGVAIEMATVYLKGLMQQRISGDKEDNKSELQQLKENMVKTFLGEADAEVVKEKVMALK
jgi:hypothetical protein